MFTGLQESHFEDFHVQEYEKSGMPCPESYRKIYRQLDEVFEIVKKDPRCFDPTRPYKVVPADTIKHLPRGYYDFIDPKGVKLYVSSPASDPVRVTLLTCIQWPDYDIEITRKKFFRLEKVFRLGWQEYVRQVLEKSNEKSTG